VVGLGLDLPSLLARVVIQEFSKELPVDVDDCCAVRAESVGIVGALILDD
jgi:hypothetical protein